MKERYLRTDTRGRVRTPRERREQLLNDFEQTGASAAAFARIVGVRYSTFAGWVHRRRQARGGAPRSCTGQSLVRFVEAAPVDVREPQAAARVVIELPGGGRMSVASCAQVDLAAELLRALEAKGARVC